MRARWMCTLTWQTNPFIRLRMDVANIAKDKVVPMTMIPMGHKSVAHKL